MGKDYGSWSLKDLKAELKKRNAKTTGKKAVLVERLNDYDKLFGPVYTNSDSVFKIAIPTPEYFRDITADTRLPAFNDEDLKMFCQQAEREDVSSSYNMYMEEFLISCRSAHFSGDYFITGLCASEMRKHILYNITIKLKNNIILEAQCECAAGVGPYGQCKHILVVLYGIIDFNKSKQIKFKASCTSSLQTFHQPRTQYSGNPIAAENLTLKFKNSKLKDMTNFDPRPFIEDPETYATRFQNLVFNYCDKNENMPIKQLRLPADQKSMCTDHQYTKESKEESFFRELKLDVNQIKDIEEKTKINKKEWRNLRKFRLHSSDFGKICKQKSNKMNLARSLIKTNEIESLAIKHGRKYEKVALEKFENVAKIKTSECGILIHPVEQYLGSTPDALVGDDEVLEIKCPYSAKNKSISGETIPYIYLCEETGEFKLNKSHDYYYQIQGQMLCSQRKFAYFFIYTLCDYLVIKEEKDNKFIEEMVQNLKCFYEDYYKTVLLNRFLYNKHI